MAPTYVSDNGGGVDFEPAPEGTYTAVCADVVDKGVVESTYAGQTRKRHMVQLRWQLGEDAGARDDGKPWLIVKGYTASIHEKASLSKDLHAWRGKAFTTEERARFDLDTLIGVGCLLSIVHKVSADGTRTYANVAAIVRPPRGMDVPKVRDYVMDRNRPKDGAPVAAPEGDDLADADVWEGFPDDAPFDLPPSDDFDSRLMEWLVNHGVPSKDHRAVAPLNQYLGEKHDTTVDGFPDISESRRDGVMADLARPQVDAWVASIVTKTSPTPAPARR